MTNQIDIYPKYNPNTSICIRHSPAPPPNSVLHTVRLGLFRVLRCQAEIKHKLSRCLVVTLQRLEVDHKIILDGEHGVGGEIRIIVGVYLRRARLVVVR